MLSLRGSLRRLRQSIYRIRLPRRKLLAMTGVENPHSHDVLMFSCNDIEKEKNERH